MQISNIAHVIEDARRAASSAHLPTYLPGTTRPPPGYSMMFFMISPHLSYKKIMHTCIRTHKITQGCREANKAEDCCRSARQEGPPPWCLTSMLYFSFFLFTFCPSFYEKFAFIYMCAVLYFVCCLECLSQNVAIKFDVVYYIKYFAHWWWGLHSIYLFTR